MKKPKRPLELDDLELDSTQETGIDLDMDSGEDDDIIELTEEIDDDLDESSFEQDHHDFAVELLGDDTGEIEVLDALGTDLVSDQAVILDEEELLDHEELLDNELLEDLVFDDDSPQPEEVANGQVLARRLKRDNELASTELEDELKLDFSETLGEESLAGADLSKAGGLGLGVAGFREPLEMETAESLESQEEEDALIEEYIDQLESRLRDTLERIVETRLPELVRSVLQEEIEKLKKDLQ